MKKLALLVVLGAMAMTSFAQSASKDEMVTVTGSKSDATQQTRQMSPAEFNHFVGSYALSNGNSLALFSRGQKNYAALHGEAWHEIVATSANSFIAKDYQMKLNIYREGDGTVHGDLYIPKADAQTAAGRTSEQLVKVAFH